MLILQLREYLEQIRLLLSIVEVLAKRKRAESTPTLVSPTYVADGERALSALVKSGKAPILKSCTPDCVVVDDLMAEATRHESTTKNSTGRT
jgi:hypothetical protein